MKGYSIDARIFFSDLMWSTCFSKITYVFFNALSATGWLFNKAKYTFPKDQSLNHAEVASQARDVKRSTEVVCPGVNLGSELDQNLNQWCVALTRSQMERGETVRVGAIHDFEHLVVLIEVLLRECEDFYDFSSVALVHFCPVVHLDFLDVLFSVFLLL